MAGAVIGLGIGSAATNCRVNAVTGRCLPL